MAKRLARKDETNSPEGQETEEPFTADGGQTEAAENETGLR